MTTPEMKQLGETFRLKREEMHLTLKEVENATSIRMSYLQAIEEGKMDKFLSRIYAIGFVRQYATFLGFEADRVMAENPQAFQLPQEKHEFAYGIGTLDMRGGPHGGVKWLPNFLWIGLGLIVLVVAWFFAKFLGIF